MIDTHSHILPGVDDGSASLDDSVQMARAASAAGIREIVCTPHLDDPDSSVVWRAGEALADLRARLEKEGIGLTLRLGFELRVNVVLFGSLEDLALLTIEGSGGAILVEVPHNGWPSRLEESLFQLRTNGFTPILAHPERNDRIQKDPALLARCIAAGGVAQATAASLGSDFGRGTQRAFLRHLAQGHISLIGTDAHHFRRLSWTFADVLRVINKRVPGLDNDLLVMENPARVLRGESLLPVEYAAGEAPAPWWRGGFLGVRG